MIWTKESGESKSNSLKVSRETLVPQPGFQTKFLKCPADILVGGGAAGVGKTYALLLECIRNTQRHFQSENISPEYYNAVVFRRKSTEVTNPGGLWSESEKLFPLFKGDSNTSSRTWTFPSGSSVKFSHLIHEKTKVDHKGGQYNLICFDELDSFSETQFWYLLSRNRSISGVKPYVRATTNPQRSGWLKDMIQWWIYPDDYEIEMLQGLPRWDRSGVVRYFIQRDSRIYWGDSKAELYKAHQGYIDAMARKSKRSPYNFIQSFTFIPGKLEDNQALLMIDPQYQAKLSNLPPEERERLFLGSWKYLPGEDQLFDSYAAMQNMFTNDFVEEGRNRYMTADIAFEGSDEFVIGIWFGWRLVKIHAFPKTDPKEVENIIKDLAREYRIPQRNICYDGDGLGAYLRGYLRTARSFNGASAALKIVDKDIFGHKVEMKSRYYNLRSQCHFLLKDIVNENGLYIKDVSPEHKREIIRELEAIKKLPVGADGKYRITSKPDISAILGRSPDYTDMIMMRMIFALEPPKEPRMMGGTPRSGPLNANPGSSIRRHSGRK